MVGPQTTKAQPWCWPTKHSFQNYCYSAHTSSKLWFPQPYYDPLLSQPNIHHGFCNHVAKLSLTVEEQICILQLTSAVGRLQVNH